MKVTIKINGQALSVEVSIEVYEYLDRADHKTENFAHEQRRHWDGGGTGRVHNRHRGPLLQGNTGAIRRRMETREEIMTVLDNCTEVQRQRFLLYALDGLSYEQITQLCGCSKVTVYYSIKAVRKKFQKIFGGTP